MSHSLFSEWSILCFPKEARKKILLGNLGISSSKFLFHPHGCKNHDISKSLEFCTDTPIIPFTLMAVEKAFLLCSPTACPQYVCLKLQWTDLSQQQWVYCSMGNNVLCDSFVFDEFLCMSTVSLVEVLNWYNSDDHSKLWMASTNETIIE